MPRSTLASIQSQRILRNYISRTIKADNRKMYIYQRLAQCHNTFKSHFEWTNAAKLCRIIHEFSSITPHTKRSIQSRQYGVLVTNFIRAIFIFAWGLSQHRNSNYWLNTQYAKFTDEHRKNVKIRWSGYFHTGWNIKRDR